MATADSLSALRQISTETCKKYGKSKGTQKAYGTQVRKGKVWLAESVARMKEGKESANGIDVGLWEMAFDQPPNKYSAKALELFLAKKCIWDGLSQNTADVIHAAFADYWDNM